jgi:hypothetical protein
MALLQTEMKLALASGSHHVLESQLTSFSVTLVDFLRVPEAGFPEAGFRLVIILG